MQWRGHAALQTYLARNRIGNETRDDGAIELVLDDIYRVLCRPAPHGAMVFETVLATLPQDRGSSDELLGEALRFAAERLGEGAEAPALAEDERSLVLQQHLAPDADVDAFEQGLEDFTNAIAVWRRQLCVL